MEYGGGGRNRTGVHGFAGRCMTTLPPRPCCSAREVCYVTKIHLELKIEANLSVMSTQTVCVWSHAKKSVAPESWSGKRGSNSRPQPWQGCALPLSYSRIVIYFCREPYYTRTYITCQLFLQNNFHNLPLLHLSS